MRYPEKYPNGFMYAAIKERKTKEERAEGLRDGSQYFLTMIEETINGFIATDAPMVLVALRVYSDFIKRNDPKAAELADMILDTLRVEQFAVYLPTKDK